MLGFPEGSRPAWGPQGNRGSLRRGAAGRVLGYLCLLSLLAGSRPSGCVCE